MTTSNHSVSDKPKVALVTGASHGIGRAVGTALAREGYQIALCARRESELAAVQREIESEGLVAQAVPCDLATAEGRAALVQIIQREWGYVNVAIHCASARTDPETDSTLEGTSRDTIGELVSTTVGGTFYLVKELQPLLSEGQPASLVLIASDWALRGSHGPPVFSAAKAAVAHFGHTIRREFARSGVSVTTVFPGDVASFDLEWREAKWSLDEPISAVRSELGDSRIALADIVDSVLFVVARKLARVEEIYLAPLSGEYAY